MNWADIIQNGLLAVIAVDLFYGVTLLFTWHREWQDYTDWDRDSWEAERDSGINKE